MDNITENLEYLLELETRNQRLDKLIRQGMLPARQLPILHRALSNIKMGKILTPYEREALSKLLDKMMGFQFGDDITYNRARLHTQKTKYQTEEKTVAKEEDVVVYDGTKDESEEKRDKKVKKNGSSLKKSKGDKMVEIDNGETKSGGKVQEAIGNRPADKEEGDKESPKQGGSESPEVGKMCEPQDGKAKLDEADEEERSKIERRFARAAKTARGIPGELTKDVRKEKDKAGLREQLKEFNELYQFNLERALANQGVENVRDIPLTLKASLFKQVDEATYSNKQIKMAKGIAFDKRYKGGNYSGAVKTQEKIKKGLSNHPEVSDANRRANEEVVQEKMASHDHDGDGKIESGKDEYMGSKDKAIKKAMKKKTMKEAYKEVLEGAREDAMRDIKRDSGRGMAPVKKDPKPGKSKHDGSENKGPAHIVSQLRGVLDQGDKHGGVTFKDGQKHKVSVNHAHKFLNKYMSGKPQDKMKMQDHGHASHDNFKKHLD